MFCWDVVLKISVVTEFTHCMKSFSLLDFAEVSVVLCIASSPKAQKIKLDKTIAIGSLRILLNCETQPPASIGGVALSSVVRLSFVPHRLHLLSSPLYDVLEHTNHISSGRI